MNSKNNKFYYLVEFPYPSGEGLHVGHLRPYIAMDIMVRKKRLQGVDILFPMGFDSFGLPAENYAIKKKVHPAIITKENIKKYKKQMDLVNLSFDWDRTFSTTDPDYYKWTQWIFIQMYKKGLAYKTKQPINWCTSCKIGLANEEVVQGVCERCGGEVVKKEKEQWMLKITKYADRLADDLEGVDYLEKIKQQQINWIGKTNGINIEYQVVDSDLKITCFTTTPVNWGASFIVISPEHPLVKKITKQENEKEVDKYISNSSKKTELDRLKEEKEKTGVFTGSYVKNHVTNENIPVWISDFILMSVGTGAVQGCPGHDKRDFEFAKKYNLPIKRVVVGEDGNTSEIKKVEQVKEKNTKGEMINSDFLDGMDFQKAMNKTMDYFEEKGWGKKTIVYKLRDWVFSRQRYWGEPIPMIYCEKCAGKKPKIILIHGLYGNSKENWFSWFKKQMETKGFEVLIPDLPNPECPKLKEWLDVLMKLGISSGDQLYIIGHSLGAPVACQFIKKSGFKVNKLILVAPTGQNQKNKNFNNLRKSGCDEKSIDCVKNINKINEKDLSKIVKNVKSSIIYISDNDPYIPEDVVKNYSDLQPSVDIFKNMGHFNESAGITKFPEILTEFSGIVESGWVPVPEKDLPVELPNVEKYEPTDMGESPLAKIDNFVNTKCPNCSGPAKRETDVMPNWAGSNWYYLRYIDPKNSKVLADKKKLEKWMPVDWYNGGMEHTTLHLLYSRFVYKFLWDIGTVPKSCGNEPYKKRTSHGMILGEGGIKMSKSKGNVINPNDVIKKFGSDTVRVYEMFIGPFDQAIPWDTKGMIGVKRFLEKVEKIVDINVSLWKSFGNLVTIPEFEIKLNITIKKVNEDIDKMCFNTAISAMMEFANLIDIEVKGHEETEGLAKNDLNKFLLILYPFAPALSEKLWKKVGNEENIQDQSWPKYDKNKIRQQKVLLVIQINGKVRGKVEIESGISEEEAMKFVKENKNVSKYLNNKEIKKVIYVQDKIINILI